MKTGHAFQHGIKNILTLTANTAMPKPEVIRHHHKHNLRNRFHVIKTLGQGTYGKVKLAVEKSSGDKVAIKSIRKDKIQNEQDLTRIRREIEIMSTLSHPHIITVYEVFENRDKIILVMEYAAGGELYDYINDRRGLSDDDARKFFRQIVSAVHYLHQNGIVHRDLKLENIVLDGESNVRIADFGLSNIYGQEQLLNTFCGSPLYASPEIVNGQPYSGPEVDCWSLGVLLYTLVYGAMPFDGTDFRKLRQQITEGNYFDPPNQSDAAGLIRKLLHVDKDKRATIMEIGHHWWINVGFEYTPLEDYYQGRPVDFHYLQKSLSITLSSDSDSELHGKGTPRVPPPPKGILKKRREEEGDVFCDRQRSLSEGGYLTNDAHLPQRTSYHRESRYHSDGEPRSSTNGDHMQTSESPVLAPPPQFDTEPDRRRRHHKNHNVRDPRNRHSWHAERPLPNVQPAFDSNKKPKRGILKNKHTCVPVVCDSGCVMDHPTDSHLGSMPGYSGPVSSEKKRWPGTLQTQSSCGSVSDIVSEGSSNKLYDLDDIESVLDDIVPANSVPSDSISGNHVSGPEENEFSFKSRLVQRSGHDDTMDLPWDHSLSVCGESVGSQSTSGDNAKQVPLTSTPIQAAQSVKKRKGILKKNGKYSSSSDTDPTWRYSLGSQGSNSSGDILNFSFDSTDGDHFMAAFYPRRPSQGESSRPYCQDFVCQNNQWDGQKVGHSDLGHFPLSFKNLGDDMLNKINTFTGEEREKHHGQENVGLFDRLEAKEVYKRAIEICNKFA